MSNIRSEGTGAQLPARPIAGHHALMPSQIRMSGEFHVRQPHPSHKDAIAAHCRWGLETGGTHCSDDVVLVDSVAADSYGTGELAVLVQGNAARKDLDSVIEAGYVGARAHWQPAKDPSECGADEIHL